MENNSETQTNTEKEEYSFVYTAPTQEERKEIEEIRRRYEPVSDELKKFEELRKLHAIVKNAPTCIALTVGIVACLIFGLGVTCCLEFGRFLIGAILSIVGIIPMACCYFIYKKLERGYKTKYRKRILQLCDEILKEQKK